MYFTFMKLLNKERLQTGDLTLRNMGMSHFSFPENVRLRLNT